MIRVRLLGGAKRVVGKEYVNLDVKELTLRELLSLLASMSSDPSIFTNNSNIIVVINGIESSLLGGLDAVINSNDQVSILTVVHGG
jgi:molybdopterin converting factor small subunit